jgi:hypothetical protein
MLYLRERDVALTAQVAGWAPGPVWMGVEYLAPTGIWSPDRSACIQSLTWPPSRADIKKGWSYTSTTSKFLYNNFIFSHSTDQWPVHASWTNTFHAATKRQIHGKSIWRLKNLWLLSKFRSTSREPFSYQNCPTLWFKLSFLCFKLRRLHCALKAVLVTEISKFWNV